MRCVLLAGGELRIDVVCFLFYMYLVFLVIRVVSFICSVFFLCFRLLSFFLFFISFLLACLLAFFSFLASIPWFSFLVLFVCCMFVCLLVALFLGVFLSCALLRCSLTAEGPRVRGAGHRELGASAGREGLNGGKGSWGQARPPRMPHSHPT